MRISDWSSDVCSSDLSGLSVEAKWTAPDGVTVGELRHPAPALLELVGLASYVHKGAFTLLTDLKLDGDIAPGTAIPLRAHLSWLACSDTLCVPERATLDLRLTAGDGTIDRSEEHTSELQSLMRISYAVFCLKKNTKSI